MKLCMFHPLDHRMERGWPGRIDETHVVQLAAQTLESFFTGGGTAREHAVYPLDAVGFLAPVLHPPAVRIFEDERFFAFANPAAIVGPDAGIAGGGHPLAFVPRIAALVGAGGALAGFTCFLEWRRRDIDPPKDRDFALGLGPVVASPDELGESASVAARVDGKERLRAGAAAFDWERARGVAARGTVLRPGDLLAGPALAEPISATGQVELDVDAIGTLRQTVR